ncbi:rubrerythrin-like domain-containing protein [Natronomonas sp.]
MFTDPYTPKNPVYECCNCGVRIDGRSSGCCPDCGSSMKNLSVPRE